MYKCKDKFCFQDGKIQYSKGVKVQKKSQQIVLEYDKLFFLSLSEKIYTGEYRQLCISKIMMKGSPNQTSKYILSYSK